jgi:hypothetical protein
MRRLPAAVVIAVLILAIALTPYLTVRRIRRRGRRSDG